MKKATKPKMGDKIPINEQSVPAVLTAARLLAAADFAFQTAGQHMEAANTGLWECVRAAHPELADFQLTYQFKDEQMFVTVMAPKRSAT